MDIKTSLSITSETLSGDIRFYGETNADDEVLKQLDQLDELFSDTLFQLLQTQQQCLSNINFYSAKAIYERITKLLVSCATTMVWEDNWAEITKIIEDEKSKEVEEAKR